MGKDETRDLVAVFNFRLSNLLDVMQNQNVLPTFLKDVTDHLTFMEKIYSGYFLRWMEPFYTNIMSTLCHMAKQLKDKPAKELTYQLDFEDNDSTKFAVLVRLYDV